MCVCVCVCVYIYIYIYIYTRAHTHTHTHTQTHIHMNEVCCRPITSWRQWHFYFSNIDSIHGEHFEKLNIMILQFCVITSS